METDACPKQLQIIFGPTDKTSATFSPTWLKLNYEPHSKPHHQTGYPLNASPATAAHIRASQPTHTMRTGPCKKSRTLNASTELPLLSTIRIVPENEPKNLEATFLSDQLHPSCELVGGGGGGYADSGHARHATEIAAGPSRHVLLFLREVRHALREVGHALRQAHHTGCAPS